MKATATAATIRRVATTTELVAALDDVAVASVVVTADLNDVPTLRLRPGIRLSADARSTSLRFATGVDGVQFSTDNRLADLHLHADVDRLSIFNDTSVQHLGTLAIERVVVRGAVRLIAEDRVQSGHVAIDGLDIEAADARGYDHRPKGYGVEVIPGAFTLWNRQENVEVSITADLTGLTAGRPGAPVRGSGIFVGGAGDVGGRLIVRRLETGAVYSDGGIAPGTPDRISGGVFTVSGAHVDRVLTTGPVTTFGANDMVLDNWGVVDEWRSREKITSHGPSGIGFVNFGTIGRLVVDATIETFGQGARGFNVYAGTVHHAAFDRVVTHADGAVGIQISRPVGTIRVSRGIETFGAVGDSLVKGVVVRLAANALSIKAGGSIRKLRIEGGLAAHGDGSAALELQGAIERMDVRGGIAGPPGA